MLFADRWLSVIHIAFDHYHRFSLSSQMVKDWLQWIVEIYLRGMQLEGSLVQIKMSQSDLSEQVLDNQGIK